MYVLGMLRADPFVYDNEWGLRTRRKGWPRDASAELGPGADPGVQVRALIDFDTRPRNREKACERASEIANFRPNAGRPQNFLRPAPCARRSIGRRLEI